MPSLASFDHLGIAVRDLDAASRFYAELGIQEGGREVIAHEQVRVALLPLAGGARLELLAPTAPESPVGRFLARHGEGLHHCALRVRDLAGTMARLKAAGARLVSEEIQVGAGGQRYIFVHPASAGGVLLELIEDETS